MTVLQLSGYGVRMSWSSFSPKASARRMLPKIEELKIAAREEVYIDSLADRIEAQARAVDPMG
jgi:hypothetical protein